MLENIILFQFQSSLSYQSWDQSVRSSRFIIEFSGL